ncbi:MAG: DoxX family membrane protein [Ignavibacteria bacterium]|nr:DoxX family membrane protein [Ignavibacteria bacterium]
MKRLFENKYFVIAVRVVLGALFMYASFDKMANPEAFANIIDNYHLLPYQLVNPLAIFLPWLEFFTGLFLIIGKWVKGSLLIYSALLVIFIIALSQALIRGLDISCGCFSVNPSSTSEVWLRIVEDIVMLFFSVMLFKYYPDTVVLRSVHEKETNLSLN